MIFYKLFFSVFVKKWEFPMVACRGWYSFFCSVALCAFLQGHCVHTQGRVAFQTTFTAELDSMAALSADCGGKLAVTLTPGPYEDSLASFFVETLCINKFPQLMADPLIDVFSEGRPFFPSSISFVVHLSSANASCLADTQKAILALLEEGFSQEEIEKSRSVLLALVDALLQENQGEDGSYLFNEMQQEFLEVCNQSSFLDFLIYARKSLASMTREEIEDALQAYFHEAKITVQIEPSEMPSTSYNTYPLKGGVVDFFEGQRLGLQGFASLKKGFSYQNTAFGNVEQYYNLALSEHDKKNIRKLITTMADKNVFQLLLEKKELEKIGRQIRHVHPLRFLGYICSEGGLRRALKTVSNNHFKWSSFIDGFKDKMKDESRRGQIMPFLGGFAEHLRIDAHSVSSYVNRSDYEGLVRYCL
jgi:hypothetical protein